MARKKSDETKQSTTQSTTDQDSRVMVTRRLPRELWTRLHNHVASIQPRTTDTAIVELAIKEYLDRHEKKGK